MPNGTAQAQDAAPPRTASPDKPATLILDEACYWRYHFSWGPVHVSPAKLKEDGEKYLGTKAIERLEQQTKAQLIREKRPADDWTKEVVFIYPWRGNGNSAILRWAANSPTPADWIRPDFDDGAWMRERLPFLVRKYYGSPMWPLEDLNLGVYKACFRAVFDLPDPAAAGKLTLNLGYRGGARVFLNGAEIARGHLPQGELTDETRAAEYGPDAYLLKSDDVPDSQWQQLARQGQYVTAPEMRGDWETYPADPKLGADCRRFGFWLFRKGWDRLNAARRRELTPITLPANLLRKGDNLLAVEVRSADLHPLALNWFQMWETNHCWFHGMLRDLSLRSEKPAAASALLRPDGVQVWAEDPLRRVFSRDFAAPGDPGRPARVVAARNTVASAQVVVGTSTELTGLKVAASELKGEGGAVLPASIAAVSYPVGRPIAAIAALGENRGRQQNWSDQTPVLLARHCRVDPNLPPNERAAAITGELQAVRFFDQLSPRAPDSIPADSCQPVWINFAVPPDAAPGKYRGTVTIEAAGTQPHELPIEFEVIGWRAPGPREFQTVMALEQSPYGVAKQYNVPLWSDEHFKLMEASIAQLARVGNDWLNIPAVCFSEFGNRDDTPIRYIRKKDGSLVLDFTILDKYLDLVAKHWGAPMVISFVVNHPSMPGRDRPPLTEISVLDEQQGKTAMLSIGPQEPLEQRRPIWQAIAAQLYQHMRDRGLADSMYWGYGWDGVGDGVLIGMMAEFTPGVKWTKGCHGAGPDPTFTAVSSIYNGAINLEIVSRRGWSRPELHLANPRHAGTTQTCIGSAPPFSWYLLADRADVAGARGLARLGADYWAQVYMSGYKGGVYLIGMPCHYLLYPGPGGAESSIRYEALIQGIQEAEARIFLEQAADRMPDDVKKRINDVLTSLNQETMIMSPGSASLRLNEYDSLWQDRLRTIYSLAAEVAETSGVYAQGAGIRADLPARAASTRPLRLLNCGSKDRAWKLAADQPWIKPARTEGTLKPGREDILITLDSSALESGKPATGKLTVTDASSGLAQTLDVTVNVGPVFAPSRDRLTFNITPGGSESHPLFLMNPTGKDLDWKAVPSADWLSVSPASGKVPPGRQCELKLTATIPGDAFSVRDATLALTEIQGVKLELPVQSYVVPPYKEPAAPPAGAAVGLQTLTRKDIKSFVSGGAASNSRVPGFRVPEPQRDIKLYIGQTSREYAVVMTTPVLFDTTYTIAGKGCKAFTAEVGPPPHWSAASNIGAYQALRLFFEVHVDGQCRAWTGPMGPGDKPRTLLVSGLDNAKEIRLVTREAGGANNANIYGCWGEPHFIK